MRGAGRPAAAWLAVVCALLAAEALPAADPPDPDDPPAACLVRVRDESDIALRSIILMEASTKTQVTIPALDEPMLMQIAPGSYYISQFRSIYDNVAPARIRKPAKLIGVTPGKVHYIGDIVISKTGGSRTQKFASTYRIEYRNETIVEAARRWPDILYSVETVLAAPGREPVVIDVAGMTRQSGVGR